MLGKHLGSQGVSAGGMLAPYRHNLNLMIVICVCPMNIANGLYIWYDLCLYLRLLSIA